MGNVAAKPEVVQAMKLGANQTAGPEEDETADLRTLHRPAAAEPDPVE